MLDSPNAIPDRAQYRLLQPAEPSAVLFDPNVARSILRLSQEAPPALAPETLLLFGDPPYARHLLDRDPLEANWHGPACRLLGAAASPKWDRLALRRAASSAQKPLVSCRAGSPLPAAEGQSSLILYQVAQNTGKLPSGPFDRKPGLYRSEERRVG